MSDTTAAVAGRVPADKFRVAVILGSVRQGRCGAPISAWFAEVAGRRADLEIDLVDLAEADLPLVMPESEAEIPAAVTELGKRLGAADGFVIVTPEYNHSFPASLKNAIDWFYDEWQAKPVSFVSYGGRAQGIRAVEQLRQVFVELHAMTVRETLSIELGGTGFDEGGHPRASHGAERAAQRLLDQLVWWAAALRQARAGRPYRVERN